MQDGLSKNSRSPDKGVLCPFGPLGADYRESESRKGSGKATFAYRFVNCNEISVINQRFPRGILKENETEVLSASGELAGSGV